MSGAADPGAVVVQETAIESVAVERLFDEIEAYLAVVDAFRCEGIVPRWAPEPDERQPSEEE